MLTWRRRIGFFVKLVPHWVKEKIWLAGEQAEAKTESKSEAKSEEESEFANRR